jgi:predicted porin
MAGLLATLTATMAGSAHAQSSVILYGIADAGLLYKTGAGPHGAGGPSVGVVSSIESTDRWGIKGVEDLGGGMSATFNLENGFRLNNGQGIGLNGTSSSVLFDRGATVGLNSRYGWLQLGRNWSPFHDALVLNDASGFINFGSLNTISYQTGSGYLGAQYYWIDNSARYSTPRIAGIEGSALYSFGGTAGDTINKSIYSASLDYQAGIFTLAAAYLHGRDLSGLTDNSVAQAWTVGGKVIVDTVRVAVNLTNFKNPFGGASQNFYTGEAVWRFMPAMDVSGAVIRLDDRGNNNRSATLFRLVGDYFLSKATNLYAAVGYVKNNSLGTLGLLNSTPAGGPGENQFGAGFGVKHTF